MRACKADVWGHIFSLLSIPTGIYEFKPYMEERSLKLGIWAGNIKTHKYK